MVTQLCEYNKNHQIVCCKRVDLWQVSCFNKNKESSSPALNAPSVLYGGQVKIVVQVTAATDLPLVPWHRMLFSCFFCSQLIMLKMFSLLFKFWVFQIF